MRDVNGNKNLQQDVLQLLQENIALKARIRSLEDLLQFSRGERAALELKLKNMKNNTHDADVQAAKLTKYCDELEAVVMAATRLLAVCDRDAVVHAIQDIVANLIGSEEMALFEMATESYEFEAIASCGVTEEQCKQAAEGLVGKVGRSGLAVFPRSGDSGMSACVPLFLDQHVIAVIAIFDLLPQKVRLEQPDIAVLKYLEKHAGKLFVLRSRPEVEKHI